MEFITNMVYACLILGEIEVCLQQGLMFETCFEFTTHNSLKKTFYTWFDGCKKDKFVSNVIRIIEKKNEDSEELLSGWFTPEQMKTELKWSSNLWLHSCVCTSLVVYF